MLTSDRRGRSFNLSGKSAHRIELIWFDGQLDRVLLTARQALYIPIDWTTDRPVECEWNNRGDQLKHNYPHSSQQSNSNTHHGSVMFTIFVRSGALLVFPLSQFYVLCAMCTMIIEWKLCNKTQLLLSSIYN